MKKTVAFGLALGLASLSACHSSPREQAADNIEANADAMADNLEDMAGNTTGAEANSLDNQADVVRATGDNMAKDMRTDDPDTNLANGI